MSDASPQIADQDRFAQWVAAHGRAVRGYLWGMVRHDDLADDLTQEVFCRAWQARSRYVEQGTARAYLLRIADRLACDQSRTARPTVPLDDENRWLESLCCRGSGPLQSAVLAEQSQRLAAALDRLSPPQRRVLLLRYYGQFSFAEIAEMLDCPLNSALSHCHRGLQTLRTLMDD